MFRTLSSLLFLCLALLIIAGCGGDATGPGGDPIPPGDEVTGPGNDPADPGDDPADPGGDEPTQPVSCGVVDGGLMSARVDGAPFCATAVTDAPLVPGFRQIAGFSAEGDMLHLVIPLSAGNFDLGSPEGIGGSYVPTTEENTTYLTIGEHGNITITELSPTRAKGTFEFTALGYHQQTGNALGSQVIVTEGVFDAALTAP